jgi:hypothetical protein
MAASLTLNIRNNSANLQNFFVFQQPSTFSGSGIVYATSLFTSPLLPFNTSGAILSVTVMLSPGTAYAGVQQRQGTPTVGQLCGGIAAIQPVALAPPPPQPVNTTTMSSRPLGLSPPVYTAGPQAGAFRIAIPSFDPTLNQFNAGAAIENLDQSITISNFVTAQPLTNLDCQPVQRFYVQIGNHPPHTVIDFASVSQNAASCDFTPGYTSYAVSYNANGSWSTIPYLLKRLPSGDQVLVAASSDPSNAPGPGSSSD